MAYLSSPGLSTEQTLVHELLNKDFVWEAYAARNVDDPLLKTVGEDKKHCTLSLEDILELSEISPQRREEWNVESIFESIETEANPQFVQKELLKGRRPWVWQYYTNALLTSFSDGAFERMLSFLGKAKNRRFAGPFEALAVSLLTQHVIQLSEMRKQLSKAGMDQLDKYMEGVVKEAWARDLLLKVFVREVDLRRSCKYGGCLKEVRSHLLGLRDWTCRKYSGSNLRDFLSSRKKTLSQCERALELREGVLTGTAPGEAPWVQVSFGRLEYQTREQQRLVRTLQGWLKRTGGNSSSVEEDSVVGACSSTAWGDAPTTLPRVSL